MLLKRSPPLLNVDRRAEQQEIKLLGNLRQPTVGIPDCPIYSPRTERMEMWRLMWRLGAGKFIECLAQSAGQTVVDPAAQLSVFVPPFFARLINGSDLQPHEVNVPLLALLHREQRRQGNRIGSGMNLNIDLGGLLQHPYLAQSLL